MKAEIKITLDEIIQGLISKDDIQPIVEEIQDQTITRFLEVLFHAPSSPISATKAVQVEEWYHKGKAAGLFD